MPMNDALPLAAELPFSLILFGASGNLAKLKLYPALAALATSGRLPEHFAIVGYARTEMDDASFRTFVRESLEASGLSMDAAAMEEFLTHVHYQQGNYDERTGFDALAKRLDGMEKGWKNPVRMAYLSIPPTAFVHVIENLCESGVRRGEFRCIVEKPVGHDLKSFEEIRAALTRCFGGEKEVFLLDHYLGKEAVRNIYYLRYANPVLERLFKNTLIHHVEIAASETVGIEGRAGYFEAAGSLRDFIQNHMLLMASLLTMELREKEEGFRESRAAALAEFYLPPAKSLDDIVLQGQYGTGMVNAEPEIGYLQEEGVAAGSRTSTFIALKLRTRHPTFDGVPFYVRTGKRLKRRETRITIQFQEHFRVGAGGSPNRLEIILQGEAGMKFHLQTKVGGTEPLFRPLLIEDPLTVTGDVLSEHGLLLLEAMRGKQQWFLSFEEVHTAWSLVDPLQAHLDKKETPLIHYPAGTEVPHEAVEWIAKDGVQWYP
jgi:glucose-6-phosphate 1-dehydrogenase